jgi:hypothetical protein
MFTPLIYIYLLSVAYLTNPVNTFSTFLAFSATCLSQTIKGEIQMVYWQGYKNHHYMLADKK